MDELTIAELAGLSDAEFVDTLGSVYETSPWVAERVLEDRPFASPEELHNAMAQAVENATEEKQLALLRAHPALGEQTGMTEASEQEQASAGLDQLTPDQYERFQELNETYEERFGFPFIMAVKNASPDAIQQRMEDRLDQSQSAEFETALNEVHEIARLRIDDRIQP
jgi:2-oxo-4-hydroxy-4-carboxy-5-ureidoimidazoline decarboxylase